MIIDIEAKSVHQIDIDHNEAFRILCKALNMAFVLDEDTDYFVLKDPYGGKCVYRTMHGHDECVDSRGDLFIALRNVAVNMSPNVGFRNADYIYNI